MPEQQPVNTPEQTAEPPRSWRLRYRRALMALVHATVFAASLMLSFLLANNMQFQRDWLVEQFPPLLVFFVLVKLVVFAVFRQYRGWWRYVGISDLTTILQASLASTFVIVFLWFAVILRVDPVRRNLYPIAEIAQSVFMLDMFVTVMLLAGLRMVVRLYHEEFRAVEGTRLKRFLIVGAGDAGETLLREIHRMSVTQYDVIGLVDDDPLKQGMSIHGIPVLGTVNELPKICADNNIEEIAIAIPSASHKQLRRVIQICTGLKIKFRTVPSLMDIASGRYRVSQIRDVDINDLLGREAVQLEQEAIKTFLTDKVIFVTGAGGSIGSEMCRQICLFKPRLLVLIEQAENPLFYIEMELKKRFPDTAMVAAVCNITDAGRVDMLFRKHRPGVVIHAAAHKHVPLMELNPGEGVKNNIIGTKTVADAADRYGSGNFVMISTDKAVNPTSIMGSCKRIAEMYIQNLNQSSSTHFVTVRFGNVLGSEGSVIPIFKKQIADGGPVTVTDPEMKRYFMTIPEASQLVLQAAAMGHGGEIFVLDMGEPVKIVDLARELIALSGFRPGEDIEITFTGRRPGEKLFEELLIAGEDIQPTRHPKINIWKNIPTNRAELSAGIDKLVETAVNTGDHANIIAGIRRLVPEYIGNNGS